MKKGLRVGLSIVGGLALLLGIALIFVFVRSEKKLGQHYEIAAKAVPIAGTPEANERGRHLAEAVLACTECHGPDLGGTLFLDAPAMGRVAAPNLTRGRGGAAAVYSPEDWDRAIRHGVGKDGRGLLIMPSEAYVHLTDGELGDVISYIQSVAPIDREFPARSMGPIGKMILAFGGPLVPADRLDHTVQRRAEAPVGAGADRGAHLIDVSGCRACHGPTLAGGKVAGGDPSWPPAGNLTPHREGLGRYSLETFATVLRTGAKVDGSRIDPTQMPWGAYAKLADEEIASIWAYLQTVEPRPMPK